MDNEIKELLNLQIAKQLQVAYIYLDFNNYFRKIGLDGYANYYLIQAKEQLDRGLLIYDYLHKNNEKVKMLAINETDLNMFKSVIQVLKYGLEVEKDVTKSITNIYKKADNKLDYRTMEFLTWFMNKQRDEESKAKEMIEDASNFENASSINLLNDKYKKRTYTKFAME